MVVEGGTSKIFLRKKLVEFYFVFVILMDGFLIKSCTPGQGQMRGKLLRQLHLRNIKQTDNNNNNKQTNNNKQIDRRYLFPETNLHRKSHLSKCDHFWPQLVWVVLWKIGTPFGPGKTSLLINTVRGADNLLLTDNWLLSLKQRSDSNPSHQHLWITSCLPSKNHFWLILDGYCARARYGFITRKSFRSRALEMTR